MAFASYSHLSGVFINQTAAEKDWLDIVSALAPAVLGLIGLWFAFDGIVRPIRANRIQNRITQLETRLNSFYGPYYHLRRKSDLLYKKLTQPYLHEAGFSVLRRIFTDHEFTSNDRLLISEIIAIGEQCEALIAANSGYIDQGHLRDNLLPRVSLHYRILKLAYEGKLKPDIPRFGDMTFPIEIDQALKDAISSIEKEKTELENKLSKR